MNPEYFRRFAERCRQLMQRARTDRVKEQLHVWAEEFEARASALERLRCADDKASDGDVPRA